jgi:hypothetical protein
VTLIEHLDPKLTLRIIDVHKQILAGELQWARGQRAFLLAGVQRGKSVAAQRRQTSVVVTQAVDPSVVERRLAGDKVEVDLVAEVSPRTGYNSSSIYSARSPFKVARN